MIFYKIRIDKSIKFEVNYKKFNILSSSSATPHISPFYNSDTIIKSDGFVYWMPMIKIKTKCNIRLENWPWDSHFCKIELGTLSQNGNFILDQKDLLVRILRVCNLL